MSVPIRTHQTQSDPVGRARRRVGVLRGIAFAAGIGTVLAVSVWSVFFSSFFTLTDIQVSGADSVGNNNVRDAIAEVLKRNIIILNTDAVASLVRSKYGNMEQVLVRKHYPHTLEIIAIERKPIGIWCHANDCTYFDRNGARWGTAVVSRGPLLLLVQDERPITDMPEQGVKNMLLAVSGLPQLGLRAVSVTMPESAPGDIKVHTDKGYDLLMDYFGDITDQLSTLGVLLSDKAKDATWAPQYIDLRTPGRVYYK